MLGAKDPFRVGATDAGGTRAPVSFAGAGPAWHLQRSALSDHILLDGRGPEVSWWQPRSQPGSEAHCRRSTSCTYIPDFVTLTYGHTYVWAQTPPTGHRCSPEIFRGCIRSLFEKFSSSRINCTHGPNKFNAIKSLLNLRHEHKCLFKCSQMIFLQR